MTTAVAGLAGRQDVARILLGNRRQAFVGFAFGYRQPCLRYVVRTPACATADLEPFDQLLSSALGSIFAPADLPSDNPVLARLLFWTRAILEKAAHPVFENAQAASPPGSDAGLSVVLQPCLIPEAADSAVRFVVRMMNRFMAGRIAGDESEKMRSGLDKLVKDLSAGGLQGFNPLHFLTAAFELGIPWTSLGGNLFQLGNGARSRWIDSSFTDATPAISSRLARNKAKAAAFLRGGGVPVPDHLSARNPDEAVRCAERLGYPVVVKPADRDGGKGVKANLRTAGAVRKAFVLAYAISRNVLVEKHVRGRDYRIQVVGGEVQGVIERVPGGVTGNGVDTVRILLEHQNEERRTATDDRRYLHAMTFDEEAAEQLEDQGLDWNAVPVAGRFVRLRGASNVASGGVPLPVPLELTHRDNLALAIRAARVLRLDVAGIDLLIPDIAASWLECGAHICEVNAQPQMFTTMHKPMLVSLMNGGDGRIPVVIVIAGDLAEATVGRDVQHRLLARNLNAGLVFGSEVWIGAEQISRQSSGSLAGGRMLCHDPAVEAMVICVTDDQVLRGGWPVDRCDVLLVAGMQSGADDSARRQLTDSIRFAVDLAPRRVIVADCEQETMRLVRALFGKSGNLDILPAEPTRETMAARAVDIVLAGDAQRKQVDEH